MSTKMTFKMSVSFDLTAIATVEDFTQAIDRMRHDMHDSKAKAAMTITERALCGLVVQAADRSLEEGIAEMLRTGIRVGLNDTLREELASSDDSLTVRVSPCKVVCDGIQANPI